MKTYARIEGDRVVEIIFPMAYEIDSPDEFEPAFKKGDEVPIEGRFTPEILTTLVDIGSSTVNVGDTYINGVFAPYTPPPPTAAEILARNTSLQSALLKNAGEKIAPLQDAVDLGEATADETAALKLWKQYRVAVNRVDLTVQSPQWPVVPA